MSEGKSDYKDLYIDGICRFCGFRKDGVLRVHSCEGTKSIKIRPMLEKLTTKGTHDKHDESKM